MKKLSFGGMNNSISHAVIYIVANALESLPSATFTDTHNRFIGNNFCIDHQQLYQ